MAILGQLLTEEEVQRLSNQQLDEVAERLGRDLVLDKELRALLRRHVDAHIKEVQR
jgi:hypothetical protein